MIDRLQKRKYAVLGMGEILLRLSPMGKDRISSSEIFEKNVGGAELNVVSGISMLGLPTELFTPLFAIARISGWSAHRIEELVNSSKIIRPAYMSVCEEKQYIPIGDRKE